MKLSRHAFTRFWDVHAWLGVTGGLVLHVMFFAGGFTLFYEELCDWQEPAMGTGALPRETTRVGELVQRALDAAGVHPTELGVALPGAHRRFIEIDWKDQRASASGELRVDAMTGAASPETSQLGRILFWLHFLYHPKAPWGMYAAGAFGMTLLLAIVTGVLIQLKDLVRQFHQFRPGKSIRVLWSDLHKVLGVMGLPFQLMYAFTGALISLGPALLLVFAGPVFGGDQQAASRSFWGEPPALTKSARTTPMLGIDALLEKARAAVPGFAPAFLRIEAVGDAAATASIWGERPGRLFARGDLVLRATDGAVLFDAVSAFPTEGAALNRWTTGLHYAWFGGIMAKILYAVLAAATCLTILSGNWIWLARRQGAAVSLGNRLLARLTIGVGGGVILAVAALFWANRLAPATTRMTVETWSFFGVWGLAVVLFLLRADARGGWVGLLGVAGVAFVAVPVLTLARFGLPSMSSGVLAGVDAGAWALGAALLATAIVVERRSSPIAASGGHACALPTTVTTR